MRLLEANKQTNHSPVRVVSGELDVLLEHLEHHFGNVTQ